MRRSWRSPWLGLLLGCCLAGCDGSPAAGQGEKGTEMARIEGDVVYRERMLLPPGAEVEVQLQDISRADAPATILATVLLSVNGGPPYPFAIEYDPATIDSRRRYALRATISAGDRLLFTSTAYIDPFAGNPVEVLVQRVPGQARAAAPSLEGRIWVLQSLGGEPAASGAGGRPVDLRFDAERQQAAGFAGCNSYTGAYRRDSGEAESGALTFGNMATTMMACADGGELERRYLQALASVTGFRLDGEALLLLAGPDVVAAYR